ncbi:alpha/beta fold hydrolase [Nocardioides flavescens]|uniref:Alpha/beta fold hydrolase n=1 Tax=Nocardioides flavescens TaxID=2691959 RepID=A0A6L7F2G1_9ACTN|nr:alpha/beta fold hydrolase [Nocardioides flavescens]
MQASPRLVAVHEPATADAVVVVLHGGASRGDQVVVSPTQLSVVRMVPTARAVAAVSRRLAVYRLLNTYRGWDATHTPVDDADRAVDRVRERYADAPVGLVGHSLGGRAALEAGDHPAVRSVVALNPWVYATDDADLSGRRVLFVHGQRDRVASPQRAEQVARRIGARADVGFVRVPEGKHAMLAHGRFFDRAAAQFSAAVLLDDPSLARGPVAEVLAGEAWVTA